ncbi:MAG TPA: chorismate synthase [Candidatus Cloacimonadota bacterium]|nr:chorismate synthase [Candidatus Cloacimonadota bacterium]HOQ80025.1 chorismate synthase [Candidatus Cloacimonadota bacterium]HPK41405.1 chorismate synthase [Candidatus Cloacimonadota bacterium]
MRANFLQRYLGFTAFGESHGEAMGIVIEDIKPNIDFPYKEVEEALAKRRPASSLYASGRREPDRFHVLSGVFEGKTTGMPICIVVYNKDARAEDYLALRDIFRPGHADYSWYQKFKIIDWRGGGRASGRETISRVIAGSMLDDYLKPIEVVTYPLSIGEMSVTTIDQEFSQKNELKWSDSSNYQELTTYLDRIQAEKDSVGGIVQCEINNIKAGLGDPVFEKLDANIAKAILSIGGVKGIEFGDGFQLASILGSESNDQMSTAGFISNHQGGILGGVSSGNTIRFRVAIKAVPSIGKAQKTIDINGNEKQIEIQGRHDICLIPRILPVIEAMIKLSLADAIAYQKLIAGENLDLKDYREAIDKIDEDILLALLRRMKISEAIGEYKKENNITIENKEREKELLAALHEKARILGLNTDLVSELWAKIIAESKRRQ